MSYRGLLFKLGALFWLSACGGGGGGGGVTSDNQIIATNTVFSGKLAQGYVSEATVWVDKLEANGLGNFQRDAGEIDTVSGPNGDYSINPNQASYMLATSGGTMLNSSGQSVPAAPMLAPPPLVGQAATNITPLTTLVAFEPSMKTQLAQYGDWNADIASTAGVDGTLLRIAKTVETLSTVMISGEEPLVSSPAGQLKSIQKLAEQLINVPSSELVSDNTLKTIAVSAFNEILADSTLLERDLTESEKTKLSSALGSAVEGITTAIPSKGKVVESEQLAEIESSQQAALDEVADTLQEEVIISLGFPALIRSITLSLSGGTLSLTGQVDTAGKTITYQWGSDSNLSIQNATSASATVQGFDESPAKFSLSIKDQNTTRISYCTWLQNPTTCDCLNDGCQ